MLEINTLHFFNIDKTLLPTYRNESLSYKEEVFAIDRPGQKGNLRRIQLDEFYLEKLELMLQKDVELSFTFSQDQVCLCFMLEGTFQIQSNGCPLKRLNPGTHNICHFTTAKGSAKCPCGAYDLLYIKLPLETFKSFSPENQPLFQKFIQLIQKQKDCVLRVEPAYIKPQIYRIIRDIAHYEGSDHFRKIYIKAKIIELISLQFEQLCGHCTTEHPLNKEDSEKMYRVRDFILANLGEYRSLVELAKMVGTNEYTLKKEFKALFGDTVFGFWQQLKMEKAQEMLLENEKAIKEISEIIGYKNPQHFSTAFKRQFKITPTQFRKNHL